MANNTNQSYPVIHQPARDATLILPTENNENKKVKKHGQSEFIAFARFFKYGCNEIREDVCVKICGHNYEPDFAYINQEKSVFIDIEIDEPYTNTGHATHFLLDDGTNIDSARNRRFQNAGWYVIRFSEEQIFCHTRECLREVYKLAQAAGAIDKIPVALQRTGDLIENQRWTKNDSYRMAYKKYRKEYLGYNPSRMDITGFLRCTWLILPVMYQSLFHRRVRKEMCRQLTGFFFTSKKYHTIN